MIQNPSTAKVSVYVKTLFLLFFLTVSYSGLYAQKQVVSPVYTNVSEHIKAYYESLPVDYASSSSKKYPLIIFLHGVVELGAGTSSTLPKIKNNSGLARVIDKGNFPTKFTVGGKDYSFIVIAPQFASQSNSAKSIDDLIAHVTKKYRVDETRIYLTGLSMGGGMTYDYVGNNKQNAEKIAAILPVCPAMTSTDFKASNIAQAKLPVWITVNSGDAASYPTNAKDAVAKIKALHSTSQMPWITVFNKSGHDAWTQTYDTNFKQGGYNVFEWLLLHSRGTSQPAVTTNPPTASAGSNQTITLPTSTATLNASGSKASSGTSISSYAWTKVSGPAVGKITSASASNTTATGLTTAGTYVFEVKVTDNKGASATGRVTITVKAVTTTPPAVKVGINQTITLPTSTVTLNASNSAASSGASISSYEWSKVSGPAVGKITSASAAKTTVTGLTTAGTYVFEMKVTDNKGASATGKVTITVKAATSSRKTGEEVADVEKETPVLTAPVNNLEVKINPNPVTTSMNVWVDSKHSGKTSIQVYSITGTLLMQKEFLKNTPGLINQSFDVSNLPRGVYVVHVTLDGKERKAVQMIKQ